MLAAAPLAKAAGRPWLRIVPSAATLGDHAFHQGPGLVGAGEGGVEERTHAVGVGPPPSSRVHQAVEAAVDEAGRLGGVIGVHLLVHGQEHERGGRDRLGCLPAQVALLGVGVQREACQSAVVVQQPGCRLGQRAGPRRRAPAGPPARSGRRRDRRDGPRCRRR